MDINNMAPDEAEIAKGTVALLAQRVGELESQRAELIARLADARKRLDAAEQKAGELLAATPPLPRPPAAPPANGKSP